MISCLDAVACCAVDRRYHVRTRVRDSMQNRLLTSQYEPPTFTPERTDMKRLLIIGTIPAALLLALVISRSSGPAYAQGAVKTAPHIGEGGLPQFEKDPAW